MLARHIARQGLLLQNATVRSRAAYHGGHHKHATMNDLPTPAGDWYAKSARQNTKYNAVLITGILALAGTIGLVRSTGIIHFNYSPPKSLD